jgi:hypothetical protein
LRTTPRQALNFLKKKPSNSLGCGKRVQYKNKFSSLCLISKEWDFAWQNVKEHVASSRFQGFFWANGLIV